MSANSELGIDWAGFAFERLLVGYQGLHLLPYWVKGNSKHGSRKLAAAPSSGQPRTWPGSHLVYADCFSCLTFPSSLTHPANPAEADSLAKAEHGPGALSSTFCGDFFLPGSGALLTAREWVAAFSSAHTVLIYSGLRCSSREFYFLSPYLSPTVVSYPTI